MDAAQLSTLIMPIGIIVIFYFFAIRPQRKKEKEINEMRSALRDGDEVVTIGGIYGKILRAKEDIIILEVGSTKTRLEVTRWSIGSVIKSNEGRTTNLDE